MNKSVSYLKNLFFTFFLLLLLISLSAADTEVITIQIPKKNISFEMIKIPAGSFTKGSNISIDEDADDDEEPQTQVTIEKSFLIGKFEVTQTIWKAVIGSNPSFSKKDNHPVEQVTWWEAIHFANKLSNLMKFDICYDEKTGLCDTSKNGFRLPSETEWEYACRAETSTIFFYGNDPKSLISYAVFDELSTLSPYPVGSLKPNGWNIHDMSGNVFEWCQDLEPVYEETEDDEDYEEDEDIDIKEIPVEPKYRIIRGGGFGSPYYDCRPANRGYADPRGRYDDTGFRLVKTIYTARHK